MSRILYVFYSFYVNLCALLKLLDLFFIPALSELIHTVQ